MVSMSVQVDRQAARYRPATTPAPPDFSPDTTDLLDRYRAVRRRSMALSAPLSAEDQMLQSMPDASPTKWHLGHTTWFFETFVLGPFSRGYRPFDPVYRELFNSYYNGIGPQHRRDARGLLSRPSLDEVMAYRAHVDEQVECLREALDESTFAKVEPYLVLGINHEQQHQELMLTDILHAFAQHPARPAYMSAEAGRERPVAAPSPNGMCGFPGGLVTIGHDSDGFCFDNEMPAQQVWLNPFRLSRRLVTNREWLEFIADRGYERVELWLSDGWMQRQKEGWLSPLYWEQRDGGWHAMTLRGLHPLDLDAPVAHISFYEADAFARWSGKRLPTEVEWEVGATGIPVEGNFADSGYLRPLPDNAPGTRGLRQLYGDVWEWTQSAYAPYPGFVPAAGAVGEYNGKFMANQMVLRGGSCVTPAGHVRPSYRNFFHPHQRWQFSGLRLAEDARDSYAWRAPRTPESGFLRDVIDGFSKRQKALPSKYFYDETGSRLFDQICELEEYYLPETEAPLLRAAAVELASLPMPEGVLVEFGSGSSVKTRTLLDQLSSITTYVPIDISHTHMQRAAEALAEAYPSLSILPLACDFARRFVLPAEIRIRPALGFFPGSTLGNFSPDEAISFLRSARLSLGRGRLLIGVDLIKAPETLIAAYNDAKGVTAAFNKNLLARINRELDGNIDLDAFDHRAIWNATKSRIESYLVCNRRTSFMVSGQMVSMAAGEAIHTENSHKFTEEGFSELAKAADWSVERSWIGEDPAYGLFLLS